MSQIEVVVFFVDCVVVEEFSATKTFNFLQISVFLSNSFIYVALQVFVYFLLFCSFLFFLENPVPKVEAYSMRAREKR